MRKGIIMKGAIEFVTKKKQRRMIEIPEEYADEVSGEFRVILILKLSKPKKKPAREREFKAVKLSTKGFAFDRDEIYDE